MHRLGLIIVLLFCALCSGAQASKDVTDHAIAIDETGTLTLSSGTKARFVDIVFPDMALSTPWLATNVLQQNFAVQSVENDRYGRSLVTAEMIPAMLQAGIAVLFPQHPIPVAWIDAETNARQAKRGVWNAKDFVLSPENAAQTFSGISCTGRESDTPLQSPHRDLSEFRGSLADGFLRHHQRTSSPGIRWDVATNHARNKGSRPRNDLSGKRADDAADTTGAIGTGTLTYRAT